MRQTRLHPPEAGGHASVRYAFEMASIAMVTVVWPVFKRHGACGQTFQDAVEILLSVDRVQGPDFRPMPAEALEIRFP